MLKCLALWKFWKQMQQARANEIVQWERCRRDCEAQAKAQRAVGVLAG